MEIQIQISGLMAHFALLSEEEEIHPIYGKVRMVLSVERVENSDIVQQENETEEEAGIRFLEKIHGKKLYRQCSFNRTIRKNYPGPGFFFSEEKDAFIPPEPEEVKVPYNEDPEDYTCVYDEELCSWHVVKKQ